MPASDQLSRFTKACPFAVMTRAVLGAVLDSDDLTKLYEEEAEQQYSHQIPFMALVWSMADLALGTVGSRNQAYSEYQEEIAASKTAYYNKLNRTEPRISEAIVRYSADKVQRLLRSLKFEPWELIPGFRCFSIDGNHFGQSDRRLEESRTLSAPPLTGTVVAKYDHQTDLFCNAYSLECAHALENTVFDRVIDDARPGEVYLADRMYCTKAALFGLMRVDSCFVIRQRMSFTITPLGQRKKIGQTETGIVFEQNVEITYEGTSRTIRRVTVELFSPTRSGENVVHLFSNLPDSVDALTIADAYLGRWEIETGFYQLTMTLCCESKGNCHPRCAILQFCMAIVAFNARRLMLAAMYTEHDEEAVDDLSEYRISVEVLSLIHI